MTEDGELYKVSEDVGESKDVSSQFPQKKTEHIRLYETLIRDLPDPVRK